MKNYLLTILLLLLLPVGTLRSQATTIHIIYNINTYLEDGIQKGCEKDFDNSYGIFDNIGSMAQEAGVDLQVIQYDAGFSKADFYETLYGIDANENDAIIYLYSGHGELQDPNNIWPLLNYASEAEMEAGRDENTKISLAEIHEALTTKGTRMTIALGSACSNDRNSVFDSNQLINDLSGRTSGTNSRENKQENLKLFTSFEGHIIASGASPGQYAWQNAVMGSFFVNTFLNALVDGILSDQPTSWSNIFEYTKNYVAQKTQHHAVITERQVPQYQIYR
jgi:hypothetical protein